MRAIKVKGFTLIELLVVVAIIAILAAIAVPNFLESQIRAKVSRVKNDHRSLKTALEAYRVDHNAYLPDWRNFVQPEFPEGLTTPVPYLSSIQSAFDLFKDQSVQGDVYWKLYQYWYFRYQCNLPNSPFADYKNDPQVDSYLLFSWGPDKLMEWTIFLGPYGKGHASEIPVYYDPTNGTVSRGDIITYGP